jgi:hypothetical protein
MTLSLSSPWQSLVLLYVCILAIFKEKNWTKTYKERFQESAKLKIRDSVEHALKILLSLAFGELWNWRLYLYVAPSSLNTKL